MTDAQNSARQPSPSRDINNNIYKLFLSFSHSLLTLILTTTTTTTTTTTALQTPPPSSTTIIVILLPSIIIISFKLIKLSIHHQFDDGASQD